MSQSMAALPRPGIPAEVESFAADRGLGGYLNAVIELAQRAFPSSALLVSVGQDAEDESHRYIAFDIDATDQSADELLAGQQAWSEGLGHVGTPRQAMHFVLGWR